MRVTDSGIPAGSFEKTFTIAVTNINEVPTANDDNAGTLQGNPVTIDVLVNDSDLDGDTLTVDLATNGANGTVVINPDNTVTYTPDPEFLGIDYFAYTVSDPFGGSNTANVSVTVTNITMTGDQSVIENAAGAVIGTLAISGPSGTQNFTLSDSRFEVVGNDLKLKDDVRLDFEVESQITLEITATDNAGLSYIESFTLTVNDVDEIQFAVFGDYGDDSSGEQAVADLVDSLNVDFIITTGDNSYGSTNIDDNIGKYFSDYIGNYVGAFGSGSDINRFFPSIGNHDYSDGDGITAYLDYFTLPGNERYFDIEMGPVHLFAINSNTGEPDGRSSSSTQAQWLESELAASDAPHKVVYMHHPPYSSGSHGSIAKMQWPFEDWGATAVLTGHDHNYERIIRDDNSDGTDISYFVSGLGGRSLRPIESLVSGSEAQFDQNYGTMLVRATDTTITFEFYSIDGGGTLIDTFTIDLAGADPLNASGDDVLNGGPGDDYMNGLSGNDTLTGFGGNDTLIGDEGDDLFVIGPGYSQDIISDFTPGAGTDDRIDLTAFGFANFNAILDRSSDAGADVVVDLDNGDQVTLIGVQKFELHDDDFVLI